MPRLEPDTFNRLLQSVLFMDGELRADLLQAGLHFGKFGVDLRFVTSISGAAGRTVHELCGNDWLARNSASSLIQFSHFTVPADCRKSPSIVCGEKPLVKRQFVPLDERIALHQTPFKPITESGHFSGKQATAGYGHDFSARAGNHAFNGRVSWAVAAAVFDRWSL